MSQGLKNIIVEKYYVSNAADSIAADLDADNTGAAHGALPVGSVTYRLYADMLPGYEFQAVYGLQSSAPILKPAHELSITTSTSFYNSGNGHRQPAWSKVLARNKILALDSWVSVGAASNGNLGILKSEDDGVSNNITAVNNPAGILLNNDSSAGIPLTVQDGMVAGTTYQAVFVGINNELDVLGDGTVVGNSISIFDGTFAALNVVKGPVASGNKVLFAQLTTTGQLAFQLNIQLRSASGNAENYVARDATGGEIELASLSYPKNANKLPVIKFISPTSSVGHPVGSTVPIGVSVADTDGTIAKVEFYNRFGKVAEDLIPPYQFDLLITESLFNDVVAVAVDNQGGRSAAIQIRINSGNSEQVVANLITPINGSTYLTGDQIAITTIPTSNSNLAWVDFFINNKFIGQAKEAPYQLIWNSGDFTGEAVIKTAAVDWNGNYKFSEPVTITVVNCSNVGLQVNAGADQVVTAGYTPKQCALLTAVTTGGTPEYSYIWNTGQITATIGTCPTKSITYTVTVKDKNGCTATDNIYVCVKDVKCNQDDVQLCRIVSVGGNVISKNTHCLPENVAYLLTNLFNTKNLSWNIGSCTDIPCNPNTYGEIEFITDNAIDPKTLTAEEYNIIYGAPTVKLYPNPLKDLTVVNLKLSNVIGENVAITVQDIVGEIILSEKIAVDDHTVTKQLNMGAGLKQGTYILRVTTGLTVITQKLIVQ